MTLPPERNDLNASNESSLSSYSNSSILIIRTKCTWSNKTKIFELNPFDTVGEAMDAHGFNLQTIIGRKAESASKQRQCNPHFSPTNSTSVARNSRSATSSSFNSPQHQVDPPIENKLYFICHGKVLSPHLTFAFQGVKSGMTIFIQLKTINRTQRKQKFLECLRASNQFKFDISRHYADNRYFRKIGYNFADIHYHPCETNLEKDAKLEEAKKLEVYRLNDIAFSSWETIVEFPTFLKEILKKEEEDNAKNPHYVNSTSKHMYKIPNGIDLTNNVKPPNHQNLEMKTIIEPATQICDQPLSNPFIRKSCVVNTTFYKNAGNEYTNVSTTEREDTFNKI